MEEEIKITIETSLVVCNKQLSSWSNTDPCWCNVVLLQSESAVVSVAPLLVLLLLLLLSSGSFQIYFKNTYN